MPIVIRVGRYCTIAIKYVGHCAWIALQILELEMLRIYARVDHIDVDSTTSIEWVI